MECNMMEESKESKMKFEIEEAKRTLIQLAELLKKPEVLEKAKAAIEDQALAVKSLKDLKAISSKLNQAEESEESEEPKEGVKPSKVSGKS